MKRVIKVPTWAYFGWLVVLSLVLVAAAQDESGTSSELGETPPLGPTEPPAALVTPEQISTLQDQTHDLINAYLVQRGWQHNCDAPGGCWLWEKNIKGQSYRLETEPAMNVEFAVEFAERDAELQLQVSP